MSDDDEQQAPDPGEQADEEAQGMREQAAAAAASNLAFLDLSAPTNTETLAQVRALTQTVNALLHVAIRGAIAADQPQPQEGAADD